MFRHLEDFRHARSLVQAIGFYLVYVIVGIVAIGALGFIAGLVNRDFGFEQGMTLGTVVAAVASLALSLVVLRAKGLLGHLGFLAVAVLSGASALAGGLILSMLFVAFLTTRQPREAERLVTA